MNFENYLDEPMRMQACQGNDPNPASSPPTIRRCAVCLANEIPQPYHSEMNVANIEFAKRIFCITKRKEQKRNKTIKGNESENNKKMSLIKLD